MKVKKTGICGTDVHIYNWDDWAQRTVPVPMVVGHEYSGEIVALGSQVRDLKIGQRVSGEGHVIGINTLIKGLNRGIGFAIPINMARDVADQLVSKGKVEERAGRDDVLVR